MEEQLCIVSMKSGLSLFFPMDPTNNKDLFIRYITKRVSLAPTVANKIKISTYGVSA